jgi:hypothetical protein
MKVSLKNEPPTTLLQHGYKNILQIPLSPPRSYHLFQNPLKINTLRDFLFEFIPI